MYDYQRHMPPARPNYQPPMPPARPNYQPPMPPPLPNYQPPMPPPRRDNQVASTVFAVIISLLVLPVIVVCAVVSMSQAGFPFGMSLLLSTVGGVVATGFIIPEVYGWMRRNI